MASTFELVKKQLQVQNQLQQWIYSERPNSGTYSSVYNRESEYNSFPNYSVAFGYDTTRPGSTVGSGTYSYDIPTTHMIGSVFCTYELPKLYVKEEYRDKIRVSWKPKTGIIAIKSASFVRNGENKEQTLRPHEVNAWIEWFAERSLYCPYNSIVEDLQGGTEYAHEHEAKVLLIPQPFFFTQQLWSGFKHVFTPNTKYSFQYIYENEYFKLIRAIDEDGKEIEETDLAKYCTFDKREFVPPKIHIRLRAFNDKELSDLWNFQDISRSLPDSPETKKAYIEPFQQLLYEDSSIGTLAGSSSIAVPLQLKESVRGIFFYIENIDESTKTPFIAGFYNGKKYVNPVTSISLKVFDKNIVYDEEHPIHFTSRMPKQAQLRTPQIVGYHYISFSDFGVMSRLGTDGSHDLSMMDAKLILHYNIPKGQSGKLHVIYDVFRTIVYYPGGRYDIYQNTMPTI